MKYYNGITLQSVVIMAAVLRLALAVPLARTRRDAGISPRVLQPCSGRQGGDVSVSWSLLAPPRVTQQQHFRKIVDISEKSRNKVDRLMQKYVDERFGDASLASQLANVRLSGMPQVPAASSNQTVGNLLNETYNLVAGLPSFLTEVKNGEMNSSAPSATNYGVEVEQVIESVYWLLCQLQVTMQDHGVPVHVESDRYVMSQEDRDVTTTAGRYSRDYVILRDVGHVLLHVTGQFRQLTAEEQA